MLQPFNRLEPVSTGPTDLTGFAPTSITATGTCLSRVRHANELSVNGVCRSAKLSGSHSVGLTSYNSMECSTSQTNQGITKISDQATDYRNGHQFRQIVFSADLTMSRSIQSNRLDSFSRNHSHHSRNHSHQLSHFDCPNHLTHKHPDTSAHLTSMDHPKCKKSFTNNDRLHSFDLHLAPNHRRATLDFHSTCRHRTTRDLNYRTTRITGNPIGHLISILILGVLVNSVQSSGLFELDIIKYENYLFNESLHPPPLWHHLSNWSTTNLNHLNGNQLNSNLIYNLCLKEPKARVLGKPCTFGETQASANLPNQPVSLKELFTFRWTVSNTFKSKVSIVTKKTSFWIVAKDGKVEG